MPLRQHGAMVGQPLRGCRTAASRRCAKQSRRGVNPLHRACARSAQAGNQAPAAARIHGNRRFAGAGCSGHML